MGATPDGTAAVRVDCLSMCVQIANRMFAKPQQRFRKERLFPAARRTNSAGGASIVGGAGGGARPPVGRQASPPGLLLTPWIGRFFPRSPLPPARRRL